MILSEREKENEIKGDCLKQKKGAYVSARRTEDRKKHRIAVLEEKITDIEADIAVLRAEAERPDVACNYKRIIEIDAEISDKEGLLSPLLAEWEQLSDEKS